jgi:hypothetical protein
MIRGRACRLEPAVAAASRPRREAQERAPQYSRVINFSSEKLEIKKVLFTASHLAKRD